MSMYGFHTLKDANGSVFYIKDGQVSHLEQLFADSQNSVIQTKVSLVNGQSFWVQGKTAQELTYILIDDND